MVAESGSRDEATAAEDEDEVRTRAEVEPDAGLSMVAERLFRQPLDPVQLSRYILLEPLGQGAFGAVYAAYDPELNRKVAIKLLVPRGKRASELTDARERFLREAQALAHFSHPNVVSIHDMGTYSLDASLHREVAPKVRAGVFLVMELVEGQRFDHWARARVRGWREILAPMIEAAQGLDAAHRAGLVHRDFKPANVLVDGEGHPKILDFGLARMRGEGAIESGRSSDTLSVSDSASSSPSMADLRESVDAGRLGDVITRTGTVVGTPRYMAPEQLLGRDAHPQSDQYAFCVTLYELLYGAPPFRGRKFDEQVQAKLRVAQLRPPTGTRVPPWLFRVVRQGLSAEPRDRFVDMDALRIALSRDPVRRRRRVALGVGAFAATIAVSAGVARQGGSVSPCESHAAELEGVWDDAVRGRVEEAFVATRLPHVDRSWRSVEGALDTWADDWARERTDLCEAGRKIDAPSSEEQARRLLCLERHRKRAAGLTRVLGSADAEVVAAAGLMAEALEDPTACTAASLAPTEPRPQDTEAAAAAEEAVAEANALLALHKTTDAAKAAHDAVDLAEALGGQHLRARARLVLAQVLLQDTRPDEARDEATAAIGAAERVGDDELACESMVVLLRALVESGNHDGANLVASLAQARAEATGVGDRVAAQLGYQLGVVRVRQARYSEAQPLLMHARLLRERSYGEDHPLVAVIDNALGVALSRDGRRDEAYDAFSRALDVFETVLGPEHPQLSKVHNNLGN
nr:serine/threonine-protein kinase [Deltaproteobacteria bacterium]